VHREYLALAVSQKARVQRMEHADNLDSGAWDPIKDSGDFGVIAFKKQNLLAKADFIRISQLDEKKLLAAHSSSTAETPIMNYISVQWQSASESPPKLLLRVVGTLDDTVDMATTDEIVEDAFKAASCARGWVLTNGSEHEVPALVGTTYDRLRASITAPLYGITAWSTIEKREQLLRGTKGKKLSGIGVKREYHDPKPDAVLETRPLQPFHTNFIFFGGKSFKEEQDEPSDFDAKTIGVRTKAVYDGSLTSLVETDVTNYVMRETGAKHGPSRVLLLIGGSVQTLGELDAFHAAGGFIIVAEDSGGLAGMLGHFMSTRTIPKDSQFAAHERLFVRLIDGGLKGAAKPTRHAERFASGARLAFTSQLKPDNNVFASIQEAVMSQLDQEEGSNERLSMAVAWGNAERLDAELRSLPVWAPGREEALLAALTHALKEQDVECMRTALLNGASPKKVDICQLYWELLFDTENPPEIYLFEGIVKPDEVTKDGVMREKADWEAYFPPPVWELLSASVPGLVRYWKKKGDKIRERNSVSRATMANAKDETVGCRVIDLYVWATLLGNTEMAIAMLPFVQEPLRAAIIGARLCATMAERLPLHAKNILEARVEHEDFAIQLLDLCDSFGPARRMLITKSRQWNRPPINLAIDSNLLRFCEHRWCQLLCDEMLRGNLDFGVSTVLESSVSPTSGAWGAAQIIMHALCPLPWPGLLYTLGWTDRADLFPEDSSFAIGWVKRQEAYVTQKEKDQEKGRIEILTLAKFYQIPYVRMLLRTFLYIVFVMLYSFVVIKPNISKPEYSWYGDDFEERRQLLSGTVEPDIRPEGAGRSLFQTTSVLGRELHSFSKVLQDIWLISLALDEWAKWARDPSSFSFDFWKRYDYFVLAFTISAKCVGLFVSEELMNTCLPFGAVLVWCRLLKFLQFSQPIGVLTIMILEMMQDIALWILVTGIFTAAFTVAFLASGDLSRGIDSMVLMPIWAMMGHYDVDNTVSQAMLWLYIVVSNVVLVNLLIAMMGDTYARVKENSDAEWKIGRLRSLLEATRQMHPVPPPFNLPLNLIHIIRNCGQQDKNVVQQQETKQWEVGGYLWDLKREKDRVARNLLKKLTKKRALESECEERAEATETRIKGIEVKVEQILDKLNTLTTKS